MAFADGLGHTSSTGGAKIAVRDLTAHSIFHWETGKRDYVLAAAFPVFRRLVLLNER
jgi:hypothetical protein